MSDAYREKRRILTGGVIYTLLVVGCFVGLSTTHGLSLGRNPIQNLVKTASEMAYPSFLDVWFGEEHFEYKHDEGEVLRTENRREREREFVASVGRALWVTFAIATLGTALASLLAIPFALGVAKNLNAPRPLALVSKVLLDATRSIHTLVFGLMFVGIVGLGPTAGILAIAAHSMGTFGKLYAESIEVIDMGPVEAVRSSGASALQTFAFGIWPAVLPQVVSTNLYIWEYNTRDSTILGIIGAGGLGLLISEAVSLFQWDRLATLLIVVVIFVTGFDAVSRRVRQALL